jgi:NhaP-type Na+/H+ or K+/H+ antiporter
MLEDFKVNVKYKLAALWTSVMFCYIYEDYFELYVPKRIEHIVSGESILNTPLKLFSASWVLIIPALMIFLSILLKPKINRLLNIIFGTSYTALMLWIASNYSDKWLIFALLFAIVESIITGIIIWYAWKWPRHNQL